METRRNLLPGAKLDRYRILETLGTGGFGVTYKAIELEGGRDVAIKEYFPSSLARRDSQDRIGPSDSEHAEDYAWGLDRFLMEARTLALFRHDHIVRILKFFKANNTAYMVLAFEHGQSLREWLIALGRRPSQDDLDALIEPLLEALYIIHKNGFLHRDIAPDNIFVRYHGGPVLLDFGAARQAVRHRNKAISSIVKHGFSPHEQYVSDPKKQGPWSDIYALAATLYFSVTGKAPRYSMSPDGTDAYQPVGQIAAGSYRPKFLKAIDTALNLKQQDRPQTVKAWRNNLIAGAK